jgi:hypothetical protein
MGARNHVGIGLLYRPARLHRLAEFIPWNQCFFINHCHRMPWKNPSCWTVPLFSKKIDGIVTIIYNIYNRNHIYAISIRHIDNEDKKWDQALSAGLLMLKNFCGGEGELLLTVRTREAATPGVGCPLLLLFFRCRRERGSQHFLRRSSDRTKIKGKYLKIFMRHAANRSQSP